MGIRLSMFVKMWVFLGKRISSCCCQWWVPIWRSCELGGLTRRINRLTALSSPQTTTPMKDIFRPPCGIWVQNYFSFCTKNIFNTFLFLLNWFVIFCKLPTSYFSWVRPNHWRLCKNSILIIWASANSLETKKNRTQDFQFLQACYLKIFEVCPVLVLRSSEQVEKYVRNSGETLQPTS